VEQSLEGVLARIAEACGEDLYAPRED
jgi:hypothetical protein